MAYFSALGGTGGTSATITVTYSEDFYGLTITATNGTTTLTKTATSSGTLVFDVSEGGTWVVSGTVEGATYSESVDVTFEYTAPPLVALPNGSTALPVNDIQMWLKCAGIRDKTTYTTLADVLADTETFIALCADSNACDYMARSTTWASGVAADSTAMLIVGKYNYCANALLGNSTWASAIYNSTYADYVISALVPIMTSNTTPSGVCSASSTYSGIYPWKAFDGNSGTTWLSASAAPQWLRYKSADACIVTNFTIMNGRSAYIPYTFILQASNDGETWTDLTETLTNTNTAEAGSSNYTVSKNWGVYKYHQLSVATVTGGGGLVEITTLQLYGYTPKGYTGTVIHSAVEDTTYYMEGEQSVPFCTIASGDTETVLASTIESLKNQTITLYSSVAKDPTNLSNDYSKQIRITPNVTEIYLMPLGSLYWYGSEPVKMVAVASSSTDLGRTAPTLTDYDNHKTLYQPNASRGCGYYPTPSKDTDLHIILSGSATVSNAYNSSELGMNSANNIIAGTENTNWFRVFPVSTTAMAIAHKTCEIVNNDYVIVQITANNGNITLDMSALWLE